MRPIQKTYLPGQAICALAALTILSACGTDDKGPTQREQIGQAWKYETKENVPLAYIGSRNSVATPTAPDSFSVLLLQRLKNGETEVTVKLVGAPFTCDLSDCAIEARADGGAPARWHGRLTDAKDGITIPPSQPAFKHIAGAKEIAVNLEVAPKTMQSFTFATAGLDWKK